MANDFFAKLEVSKVRERSFPPYAKKETLFPAADPSKSINRSQRVEKENVELQSGLLTPCLDDY